MTVKGLAALNKKLDRMPRDAKVEIKKALNESADRVVALARGLAPVDEGDLRASIRKEPGRHELAIDVKAGGPLTQRPVRSGVTQPHYDYSAKIEAESPFFYGAWRALRKSVKSRLSRAYRDAVKKGGGNVR
jgi:hypothetical protein